MISSKVNIVHDHAVTTTGGEVWKAANVLVLYVSSILRSQQSPPTSSRKLNILELGSGCGFAALELARRHHDAIENIVCTEQADGVQHLQRNIDLNAGDGDWSRLVSAQCYDWKDANRADNDSLLQQLQFDFVIGSDLVYSDVGLRLLVNVFVQLQRRLPSSCRFLYAHTLHRFDMMDHGE